MSSKFKLFWQFEFFIGRKGYHQGPARRHLSFYAETEEEAWQKFDALREEEYPSSEYEIWDIVKDANYV